MCFLVYFTKYSSTKLYTGQILKQLDIITELIPNQQNKTTKKFFKKVEREFGTEYELR